MGRSRLNRHQQAASAAQSDLRRRQNDGDITPASLEELRDLQREVQSTAVITDFARAQQEAVAYLPQVIQEISELLGVDFAALAGAGELLTCWPAESLS